MCSAAAPFAACHRFGRTLSVRSGRQKAKARSLPTPCPSQPIAHRGPCGKTRVVLQNLRPKPEPAEIRDSRSTCALVDVWVSRSAESREIWYRRWDSRCGCGHSARRCGCARRRTARSSWPECNLVEWGAFMIDVIVAGGGPTGLMLAGEFAAARRARARAGEGDGADQDCPRARPARAQRRGDGPARSAGAVPRARPAVPGRRFLRRHHQAIAGPAGHCTSVRPRHPADHHRAPADRARHRTRRRDPARL